MPGNDTSAVDGVAKIVVLRANAIGDYVVALPALTALRQAYPRAEVVLVGAPWHARFLPGRPGPVDRVLVLPPVPGMAGTFDEGAGQGALDRLVARVRAERFDVAVQLHGGGAQSNPLVRSFGAGLSVGMRADGAAPLDRWVRYDFYQPEVLRYLEVVGLVGARASGFDPVLALLPADREEADAVLGGTDRPVAALHPGVSDPRRRWPVDRFAAVGDDLAGAGAQVVVTGGPGETGLVAAVVAAMRRPARSLAGKLSLGGLAALYARCAVVVGNDTGPVHVAQAVGTPTVGIYWCGNLINAGPLSRARNRPQVGWLVDCPRCGAPAASALYPERGGTACAHQDSFVTDVTVEEVRDAALDLLARG